MNPALTEAQWSATVVGCAVALGWRVYHTFDSRRSESGFPDLVLMRERVVFAELKTTTGKLSRAQVDWRERTILAGGEYHLWRPEDWITVQDVLTTRQMRLADYGIGDADEDGLVF